MTPVKVDPGFCGYGFLMRHCAPVWALAFWMSAMVKHGQLAQFPLIHDSVLPHLLLHLPQLLGSVCRSTQKSLQTVLSLGHGVKH